MRALLFAYYFPPMGGIGSLRALSLARDLPEAGVEVTVIAPRTGTYAHDPSFAVEGPFRVVRTGTLEPGVLLRRERVSSGAAPGGGAGRPAAWKGLLGRFVHVPDANAGWVPAAVAAGIEEGRRTRVDVVLSSSPPLSAHLAAAHTAARLGAPFVPDFRDFLATQRLYRGIRGRVDFGFERLVLRRARGIVAATEGVAGSLAERTDRPRFVLWNGYDEEDFRGPAPAVEPVFRLVHVGSSYADRHDPGVFLGAVRDLAREGVEMPLRFVGAPDPALVRAVEEAGVPRLTEYAGFTSHAEAIREMRAAPALLLYVWARPGPISRGVMAGKTFEYLRSGRPVLLLGPPDGETARMASGTGGALACRRDDKAGIRDALLRLSRREFPAPAAPARLAPYARRKQVARLASWLEEILR